MLAAIDKMEAGKAVAAILTEEKLETGDAQVETRKDVVSIDKNQTEDTPADDLAVEALEAVETGNESDSPAGVVKLSDEFVAFILAIPKEAPLDPEDIPFMTTKYDLAKLLNQSEEWVEEQRQRFKEDAALEQRIYDDFVLFQNSVREEFFDKGYVEVDEECLNQFAELEAYQRELWDDWVNTCGLEFAHPSDPRCAIGI